MIELSYALLGGLIASILAVIYSYISEQYHLRSELAVDIVEYSDQIYDLFQQWHVYKDALFRRNNRILTNDQYFLLKRELATVLKSSNVHMRTALVFGNNSNTLGNLIVLRQKFHDLSNITANANQQNWAQVGTNITNIFDNEIEPLRTKLENSLIIDAQTSSIIKGFYSRNESLINAVIFILLFITILMMSPNRYTSIHIDKLIEKPSWSILDQNVYYYKE